MTQNLFVKGLKDKPFLIMAHRGFWGGNIIENTRESAFLAYKAGADIVEVDVCRTSDGAYYLFHDGNESRLLKRSEDFSELSAVDVDKNPVYNSIGTESGYTINSLSQFLEWLPEGRLVNIDRSWNYWNDPQFFDVLKASKKQHQIVLKSPVKKEYLDAFSAHGQSFFYVPIVLRKEDWELVQSYRDIQTIGLELVVSDLSSDLLTEREWLDQAQRNNIFVVANAEMLGASFQLFGKENDDSALFGQKKWDAFVQSGIDVIQTDWPAFLSEYRKKI